MEKAGDAGRKGWGPAGEESFWGHTQESEQTQKPLKRVNGAVSRCQMVELFVAAEKTNSGRDILCGTHLCPSFMTAAWR